MGDLVYKRQKYNSTDEVGMRFLPHLIPQFPPLNKSDQVAIIRLHKMLCEIQSYYIANCVNANLCEFSILSGHFMQNCKNLINLMKCDKLLSDRPFYLSNSRNLSSTNLRRRRLLRKMDGRTVLKPEEISVSQVAMYAAMSFLIVSILGVLIYITCSKKYRLNWFEKHLLESAGNDAEDMTQSQEILLNRNAHLASVAGSSRSLNHNSGSPISNVTTNMDDPSFWVPHALGTQVQPPIEVQPANMMVNVGYDTATGTDGMGSDDSLPPSPTSPTESNRSITSANSSTNVPLARGDKHILLAMSPARPKVSSMQTKLDYTKIDTSLYVSAHHVQFLAVCDRYHSPS